MDVRVRGALTTLRRATESDVDLLVRWHDDPDVARYWDDETFTDEQVRERLHRPDVDPYIVEAAGVPVGYAQVCPETEGSGGIDMFLVPGARGFGYGPDAARALATYLRDQCGWTDITVDPYSWNERAIRAWERAGFARVNEQPADAEHTSPWILMVFEARPGA